MAADLRGIDLNLLVIFRALLQEGKLTKAARSVGLSQSAMSNALGRLRETFADPLFVRTPRGMLPTAKARALADAVLEGLGQLERALSAPESFEPRLSEMTFRIATTDYSEMVLFPSLVERLRQEAPRLRLETVVLPERIPFEALAAGKIDLALGNFEDAPQSLYSHVLYREHFTCMVRRNHPLQGRNLTAAEFASLEHLFVAPWGTPTGIVDTLLAKQKLRRAIRLTVPYFTLAPIIIAQTDMITTLPEHFVAACRKHFAVDALVPPIKIPGFAVSLLWHEKSHREPSHQWLRKVFQEITRDFRV